MDPQQTAANYANQLGVGPQDSSTIDKGSEIVTKGIETVQSSVLGQKKAATPAQTQETSSGAKPPHEQEVDDAHPAAVEEFVRAQHRSDPVSGDASK